MVGDAFSVSFSFHQLDYISLLPLRSTTENAIDLREKEWEKPPTPPAKAKGKERRVFLLIGI